MYVIFSHMKWSPGDQKIYCIAHLYSKQHHLSFIQRLQVGNWSHCSAHNSIHQIHHSLSEAASYDRHAVQPAEGECTHEQISLVVHI